MTADEEATAPATTDDVMGQVLAELEAVPVDRNRVPRERMLAWGKASCEAQGVPFKITDPKLIETLAPLFGAGTDDARAMSSRRA